MQISVIIPVYNASAFVTEAVESALAQRETGQVILIDDGSQDDSLEICHKLSQLHPRVEVLRHPDGGNHGVSASRNLGISAARCEYVAFLDADDFYLPGRFIRAHEIMTADPSIDGVYDAIGTVYEDESVGQWYRNECKPELMTIAKPVDPSELFDVLMDGTLGFFCTDGIVVRRELFAKTGMFDTSLKMCEDTALWLKMSLVGWLAAGSLTEPVGMRRLHTNNTIFQCRDHNSCYEAMMAESVLRWGRKAGVPFSRLVLFVNLVLNLWVDAIPRDAPYFRRKIQELQLFARFTMRYPLALRSQHYWSVVGATVGWKPLKGTCSRTMRVLRRALNGFGYTGAQ